MQLRLEDKRVNYKRIERVYREERLLLRHRTRKKTTAVPRVSLPLPRKPGYCCAMDFVLDLLSAGRWFKGLTMNDLRSKEVPVIEVDSSTDGGEFGGFWISSLPDDLDRIPRLLIIDRNSQELRRMRGPASTEFGCTLSNRGNLCNMYLLRVSTNTGL